LFYEIIGIGSINEISGTYGRWIHLGCWRVPSRIWLGLPDPENCLDPKAFEAALMSMNSVAFCAFSQLAVEQRAVLVRHVMNKSNWAKLIKKMTVAVYTGPGEEDDENVIEIGEDYENVGEGSSKSVLNLPPKDKPTDALATTSGPQRFIVPRPGLNGALENSLAGKTVVLTGVFPELGGGAGLGLGKIKAKAM
jgi:hypothetical protein